MFSEKDRVRTYLTTSLEEMDLLEKMKVSRRVRTEHLGYDNI